VFVFLVLYGRP